MTGIFGKTLNKKINNQKGFTLIELIVVVAVLGILATLVVPRVTGIKDKAETSANAATEKIIKNALERYYAEKGEYPDELEDLEGDFLDGDFTSEWNYNTTGTGYTLTAK